MIQTKPVGRNASAMKYDILTALGAHALAAGPGDRSQQKRSLRLLTLITARYNWRTEELVVGRREMARLWCVDERTVKRELARLKALGWIAVKRPAARGRITVYQLCLERILADTAPAWANVGEDFAVRMGAAETGEAPAGQGTIVAFPGATRPKPPDVSSDDEWALASGLLYAEDANLHAAWFAALTRAARTGDRLLLHAPSRFHASYVQGHLNGRLLSAVRQVDASVSSITVTHG
ncbi:hypothetical protein [Tropicimonas isoalkanivorans]|uniref:DnaA N-terminal domain-containing protein n=1 Tax=Tropicimonas isoalkanivorans TaxID=441112 RepID=A0A1I1QGI8_9RHOB|nr:hypothetical protein [Tropicimonas isoalkanivorans]SFD17230.1 hypothetical protein SAMN04488094_11847 [Tropicimonas isoalkanivorans]